MTIGPETNEARGGRGRRESVRPPALAGKMRHPKIRARAFSSTAELRPSTPAMRVRFPQGARAAVQRPGRSPKPRSGVRPLGGPPSFARRSAAEPERTMPAERRGASHLRNGLDAEAVEALPCQGRGSGCDSRRDRQFLALSSKGRTRCSGHRDGGSSPPEATTLLENLKSKIPMKSQNPTPNTSPSGPPGERCMQLGCAGRTSR